MLHGLKATDPPVLMVELSNSVINVQCRSPILLMTVTRSDPAVSEWFDSNMNMRTKILSWRFLFSRRWFQTSFLNDGVISIGDVSSFYRLPVPPAGIVHHVLSRPSVSDLRKRLHMFIESFKNLNFRVAACHWTNITKESNEGRDFSLPSMREVQYLSIDLRALCDERLWWFHNGNLWFVSWGRRVVDD